MLLQFLNGITSVILRVKIYNVTNSQGLTGLTSASTGLIISTIAENEATPTVYTVAGSTTETIATLGTFAAPTATKCRFKEVDSTNHPGLYEIQIADARWAVSGARNVIVSISGVTNMAETDKLIDLFDPLNYVFDDTYTLTTNGIKDRVRLLSWILRNKMTVVDLNGNTVVYKDNSTTAGFTVAAALTDDSTTTTRLRIQ